MPFCPHPDCLAQETGVEPAFLGVKDRCPSPFRSTLALCLVENKRFELLTHGVQDQQVPDYAQFPGIKQPFLPAMRTHCIAGGVISDWTRIWYSVSESNAATLPCKGWFWTHAARALFGGHYGSRTRILLLDREGLYFKLSNLCLAPVRGIEPLSTCINSAPLYLISHAGIKSIMVDALGVEPRQWIPLTGYSRSLSPMK